MLLTASGLGQGCCQEPHGAQVSAPRQISPERQCWVVEAPGEHSGLAVGNSWTAVCAQWVVPDHSVRPPKHLRHSQHHAPFLHGARSGQAWGSVTASAASKGSERSPRPSPAMRRWASARQGVTLLGCCWPVCPRRLLRLRELGTVPPKTQSMGKKTVILVASFQLSQSWFSWKTDRRCQGM